MSLSDPVLACQNHHFYLLSLFADWIEVRSFQDMGGGHLIHPL